MNRWSLLIGAASLGLFGVPASGGEGGLGADGAVRLVNDEVRESRVSFENLPGPARRALREQQQGALMTDVTEIRYEGRTTYRARFVDANGSERLVRVNPDGQIITEREEREAGGRVVDWNALPERVRDTLVGEAQGRRIEWVKEVQQGGTSWYTARLGNGQMIYVSARGQRLEAPPPLLSERGDRGRDWRQGAGAVRRQAVRFDTLPGEVKEAIARTRGQDQIVNVVRIVDDGQVRYRARVEGAGRSRLIFVDENGRVLSVRNATEPGWVYTDFQTLPGPVKNTISRQTEGQPVEEVIQVTRQGRTWYIVEYVGQDNDLYRIRVDNTGRLLSRQEVDEGRDLDGR